MLIYSGTPYRLSDFNQRSEIAMSEHYRVLLEEWKVAGALAREAQKNLNLRLEAFLRAEGTEPTEAEREYVRSLQEAERAALQAALDYVRETALGKDRRS